MKNIIYGKNEKEIEELQKLKEEVTSLKGKILKQRLHNFKAFNIRNLRFFNSTCKFLVPFVLSTSLAVGITSFINNDFSFNVNRNYKYKVYHLNYETDGYISMDDYYQPSKSLLPNELTVYTPWELKDNQYMRYKRVYDVNDLSSISLYNAIIDEDYDYILENMNKYIEEIQYTNYIADGDEKDYYCKANLYYLDVDDVLLFNDPKIFDIKITFTDCCAGFLLGIRFSRKRKFNYVSNLNKINEKYYSNVKTIRPLKEKVKVLNKKILFFSKTNEGEK